MKKSEFISSINEEEKQFELYLDDYYKQMPDYFTNCLKDPDPDIRNLAKRGISLIEKYYPDLNEKLNHPQK